MLYPAYSKVGREILVLRHYVFLKILKALNVECRNSTMGFASLKINKNKYFISSSGDETHNKSHLLLHTCMPAPQLAPYDCNILLHRYFINNGFNYNNLL